MAFFRSGRPELVRVGEEASRAAPRRRENPDPLEKLRWMSALLDAAAADGGRLNVIEGGCGRVRRYPLTVPVHVTGVDIAEESTTGSSYCDEIVIADLERFSPKTDHYDAAVLWDVLEHLSNPRAAIDNLASGLRPGGLFVIAGPNPQAARSFVTRHTPHWVHIAYRRFVARDRNAGRPGFPPFKTYLRAAAGPDALARHFESDGWTIVLWVEYAAVEVNNLRKSSFLMAFCYQLFEKFMSLIWGRDSSLSEFYLVAKKSDPAAVDPQKI